MSGWFAMKRGITSHALFAGQPERLAIWIWLLDHVAWKDTRQDVNGRSVPVPRGSVLTSERRIADDVGVGYQVVRTFLCKLAEQRMIKRTANAPANAGRSLITLCNWDKYQLPERPANADANAGPNAAGNAQKEQGPLSEKSVSTTSVAPTVAKSRDGKGEPPRFIEFWEVYPHKAGKVGRKPAVAAYRRALKRGATDDTLIAGARRYHHADTVRRGVVRLPATWLNQDGWEDEIASPAVVPQQSQSKGRTNGWADAWLAEVRSPRMDQGSGDGAVVPLLPRGRTA